MVTFILNRHKSRFKQRNQLIILLQIIQPFLIRRKLRNAIPLRAYPFFLNELPLISLPPQIFISTPELQFLNPAPIVSGKLDAHIA